MRCIVTCRSIVFMSSGMRGVREGGGCDGTREGGSVGLDLFGGWGGGWSVGIGEGCVRGEA